MNKQDLVTAMATSTGLTQKDVTKMLDAFIDNVSSTLKKGEELILVNFGTFKVSHRQARGGRNPKTGAAIQIPASKVPQFKAGKALRDAVG